MAQGYQTILQRAQDEFVERKSRFLGCIEPVKNEREALAFLEEKRREHWNAAHNVYAYLLRKEGLSRCSDDGEPQGTAGVPVLEVLKKAGLTDVCVVVTRYFGGILLGAGGLVRAYAHGAKLAVQAAHILHMNPCTILQLECRYDLYGKISRFLPNYHATVLQNNFGETVQLEIRITSDAVQCFCKQLDELTAAQVPARIVGEVFADQLPPDIKNS